MVNSQPIAEPIEGANVVETGDTIPLETGYISLWHAFVWLTLVAIVLASAAPFVRHWRASTQWIVGGQWFFLLLITYWRHAFAVAHLGRIIRRYGPCLASCRTNDRESWWVRLAVIAGSLALGGMMTAQTIQALNRPVPAGSTGSLFWGPRATWIAVTVATIYQLNLVWMIFVPGSIHRLGPLAVFRAGLLIGGGMIMPWERIQRFVWSSDGRRLSIYGKSRHVLNVVLKPGARAYLEPFLAQHEALTDGGNPPISGSSSLADGATSATTE